MRNVDKCLIEILDKNLCQHIYYLRTNELCPKGEDNSVCQDCHKINQEWLAAEYIAPEIDWNKVPMGTPVRVWLKDDYKYKRNFVAYDEDRGYKFITLDETIKAIEFWANAELIEVDDESNR